MNIKYFGIHKIIVALCLFILTVLFAYEARAIDILEIRVKRLYQEAQTLEEKGDYDGAIEIYNKAILMAKDKDIKQFLINAKKELQKKKRAERGDFRIFRVEEEPEEMIFEPMRGEMPPTPKTEAPEEERTAEERAGLEEEKAKLEAERRNLEAERAKLEEERRRKEVAEEKARLEEERERLEADRSSFEEERRRAEEERQKALKAFEETPEKVMRKEELPEETAVIEQKIPEEEVESTADLEARKEREARDRAIYESSSYRLRVKEILNGVRNRMKEVSLKVEEEEAYRRVEPKINKLTALDQQAEEFISKGEYEKAKGAYEEILTMSKDPDIKEYIKRHGQLNQ